MAGLLACAAFNAQAEVNPFGYGVRGGLSISSARGSDVKINSKEVSGSFFDTFFGHGSLYAEYAFTDYIGMGLEVGYMKIGGTLTDNNTTNSGNNGSQTNTASSNPSIAMASHGIAIPLHLLQIYPLGREEESGILKINVGGTHYFPVKTSCKQDGVDVELKGDAKKQLPFYIGSIHLGAGYEFPFGLSIDAKYAYGLYNSLSLKEDEKQAIFQNSELSKFPTQHVTLGVGFNFMSLFTQ